MSHMPTSAQPGGSGGTTGIVVTYTATGLEGTSFLVPIGQTLVDADYEIVWSPSGVTNVPVSDMPRGVGDRTTTYFRVTTADVLTAGDRLVFVIFQA